MPLMGNKSAGAIFGTFICRFDISTALSELNVPLMKWLIIVNNLFSFYDDVEVLLIVIGDKNP